MTVLAMRPQGKYAKPPPVETISEIQDQPNSYGRTIAIVVPMEYLGGVDPPPGDTNEKNTDSLTVLILVTSARSHPDAAISFY